MCESGIYVLESQNLLELWSVTFYYLEHKQSPVMGWHQNVTVIIAKWTFVFVLTTCAAIYLASLQLQINSSIRMYNGWKVTVQYSGMYNGWKVTATLALIGECFVCVDNIIGREFDLNG